MTGPRRAGFLWRISPVAIRAVGRALFSLRVEHEQDLPAPPFVFASNHYSHFDSPVVAAVLDRPVRYLALDHLFGPNRLLDWLIEGYGAIPTPRDRVPVGAVRSALAALDNGEVVGVFPEATRVSHWGTLEPKRGAAWLARRAGVPLVPIAVIGTGRAFGLDNRLRISPVRVVVGSAIDTSDADSHSLTKDWSAWMDRQIARFPGSEADGPGRSGYDV